MIVFFVVYNFVTTVFIVNRIPQKLKKLANKERILEKNL